MTERIPLAREDPSPPSADVGGGGGNDPASGYPAPVFAVSSGSVPAGLGLTSTAALSGTPGTAGASERLGCPGHSLPAPSLCPGATGNVFLNRDAVGT